MSSPNRILRVTAAASLALTLVANTSARALLPPWLQHVIGSSAIEAALYRAMQLPGVQILYPRPPKEAQTELAHLSASAPDDAALYQLRARADEQALDENAAERDWKLYTIHTKDAVAAKLELADFYQRRMLYPQEIATLNEVAAAPTPPAEIYLDPTHQRSWIAFERILTTLDEQGFSPAEAATTFDAALTRYPDQPALYAATLQFDLEQKDWNAATVLIARYQRQLPHDEIFPVRAKALLEFRRGNIDAALAVYDHAFQPLWSADLVQSYLALLAQTHRQRAFVATARQQLTDHPDGPEALNALARIFYYDQQAGRGSSALQSLEAFRIAREARKATWSPEDLSTLAQLSTIAGSYAESARYNYALAATPGNLPSGEVAAQAGLAGLIHILLSAPDQPLAIGASNLTLYRDIATLDQGPGYWNGILSLWLNGESPATEYASETDKAQSYFDRSKAAELLADLDKRFPSAPERSALHAELIQALTQYGEPAAVIDAGKQFLSTFPASPERLRVADSMADAYAQQKDTANEFALYESQLIELAAKTGGLPLTAASTAPTPSPDPGTAEFEVSVQNPDSVNANAASALKLQSQSLAQPPTRASLPEATAYARVLDRYLGRLTATNQLPRALTVLRQQLDHNPNDPLLYERLSSFLQQNNLSAAQEEVFQLAIAKFQEPTYYDKLARFYLRIERRDAFAKLTRQVTDIFSGTDLDAFFANVADAKPIGPQLALELNLYAAKRFPHDLVFTHNLLAAYQAESTRDPVAYEALLRTEWWTSDDLRDQFLAFLSRTGKLQSELAQLQPTSPAAQREQAEIAIFTSHFEDAAAPLGSLAELYPSNTDTGDRAVSLFRSLAYLDATSGSTAHAVDIEKDLLAAEPDSPDRLATLGDLYAEATSDGGEDLAAAAPYWHRIPELHPGSSQGFLTTSTIFWDYFQFDDALAELTSARSRFHSESLFGYEAGAIAENRHDLPRAVAEYTNAFVHPLEPHRHFDSGTGVILAWLNPPSDAADSNLRSTTQSFLGSEESRARLLQLATRASTRSAVDDAASKAVAVDPANTAALTLRADILAVQHSPSELTPLLITLFNQALDRASTLEECAAVGDLAQARSLTSVYERALAKQATLTLDPVQKIELQYTLVRSLESHNEIAAATRLIATVYSANPRILGVVRATTDFYDRTDRPQLAIATLLEASHAATPSLAHDFTVEAATKANESGDTKQARTLALGLLIQSPYDANILAVIADSYARAHDDTGLKEFYLAQLDAAAKDPALSPDARKQNVAVLRRGLIPALTRLHDTFGATAQYIALLSAYPEDTETAQEAALYTLLHSTQPQLLEFLRTTVKQSPHDSRFMILLAQVQTTFEDLPAAEQAYSLAIAIRSDRVDLYTARADLETRLSQTDPAQAELATADFQRVYKLSYHDPAWMLRLAELRARQGRRDDAVNALKTAYIAGHAETATDFFTVAAQLSAWNLLPEARTFAEHGVALAGPELLTPPAAITYPEPTLGAVTYTRILTRLGMADRALATLVAARRQVNVSASSPATLAAALAKENISDDDAADFRKSFAARQKQAADQNLQSAIHALGDAVQTWYTPEQKQSFAQSLDKLRNPNLPNANPRLALQVATAAGFTDREAAWRQQALVNGPLVSADVDTYTTLQRQRLQFVDLAHTLERYAARLQPKHRQPVLVRSAQAYRDAAETTNETRITQLLVASGETQLRDRYFHLLLLHNTPALNALAASPDSSLADAAVNYSVANGTETQALAAVTARGRALPPVWRPASASLIETFFASQSSTVSSVTDFTQSLAWNTTIADRLGKRPDTTQQLTGDDYFFYSSRFGIFLSTVPKAPALPEAEDFLAAQLEDQPTSSAPYLNLARTYAEAKNIPAAVLEYNHALELSPADPAILDEFASVLYRSGRKDEAIAEWTAALARLRRMQEQAMYPESWFTSFETITRHLGEHGLTQQLHSDLETILSPYFAKNGTYRSNELLESVYNGSASTAEGVHFILSLSHAAQDPDELLRDLSGATWLADEAHEAILLRRVELARNAPAGTDGQLLSLQQELITLYLDQNQTAQAQSVFDTLSANDKKAGAATQAVILAVRTHHLQPLLDAWHADPDTAASPTTLAVALTSLQTTSAAYQPDPTLIRPLQEYLFARNDQTHTLLPTDLLSLAQTRIDTADTPGALQLLQRLALLPVSPSDTTETSVTTTASPYTNLDHAADLLERNHLPAQALPFLRSLVQLTPWTPAYRLRLAAALYASNAHDEARTILLTLAADISAPYSLRIEAARALGPLGGDTSAPLGSTELSLVAHPSTPTAARQPYFAAARLAAAAASSTSILDRQTLLREAIGIEPASTDAARARVDLLLLQPVAADPGLELAIYHSLQDGAQYSPSPSSDNTATPDDTATDSSQSDEDTSAPSTRGSANDSPDEVAVAAVTLPAAASSFDATTRVRLALKLSSAFERDGDEDTATGFAQLAVELATQSTAAEQAVAKQRQDAAETAFLLARRNAQRLPHLTQTLAQSVQVRPRLSTADIQHQEAP